MWAKTTGGRFLKSQFCNFVEAAENPPSISFQRGAPRPRPRVGQTNDKAKSELEITSCRKRYYHTGNQQLAASIAGPLIPPSSRLYFSESFPSPFCHRSH
mmetsp:Transcript_19075/g.40079  ORF Transcript_19075/g.40079 Transcript_19075/m.40079 type:complete len:100 (+) Transcript_19075:376-675(+)